MGVPALACFGLVLSGLPPSSPAQNGGVGALRTGSRGHGAMLSSRRLASRPLWHCDCWPAPLRLRGCWPRRVQGLGGTEPIASLDDGASPAAAAFCVLMLLQPARSGGVHAWKGPWDCPVAIPVVSLSGSGVASVGGLLPGHPLSPLVGRVCACVAFRLPMCRRLSGSSLHSGGHCGVRSLLRAPPCPPRVGSLHLPTDGTGR